MGVSEHGLDGGNCLPSISAMTPSCERTWWLARHEGVWVANLNADELVIVSGLVDTLDAASADLLDAGARRVLPLPVRGCLSHSTHGAGSDAAVGSAQPHAVAVDERAGREQR